MAANIFDGSTDNTWGTAANWSLGTVPTATDGHVATFDATSPSCSIITTARACNGLDMTGYLNTLSGTQVLTINGDCTLGGIITGTITLGPQSGTWTSNGIAWPYNMTPNVAATITFADDWVINGTFTHTTGGGIQTYNGGRLIVKGNWTQSSDRAVQGTTECVLSGTGSQTLSATGFLSTPFTIDKPSGTCIFGVTIAYSNNTFRHLNGVVDTTTNNSSFNVSVNSTTTYLYCSGITFDNMQFIANETVNIMEPLSAGTITCSTAAVIFSGDYGFTTGSFTNTTGNLRFGNGNTYRITSNMSCTGLLLNTGEIRAISGLLPPMRLILDYGATQNNSFTDFQLADSSEGQTIYTRKGFVIAATTKNIALLVPPRTTGAAF